MLRTNLTSQPVNGQDFDTISYPVPQYVPSGYKFVSVYNNPSGGFGGGLTEVALWYKKLDFPNSVKNPLAVYVAAQPKRTSLGMPAPNHEGTVVTLTLPGSGMITAHYYDGTWAWSSESKLIWDTGNMHSLAFNVELVTVGVIGSRLVGVSFDELIHVAESIYAPRECKFTLRY